MKAARYAFLALLWAVSGRAQAQDVTQQAPAEGTPVTAPEEPAAGPEVSAPSAADQAAPTASVEESASQVALEPAALEPAALEPAIPGETHAPAEQVPEALSDAELAILGLSPEKQGLDTDLHFSGFMDVNMMQLLNPGQAPTAIRSTGDEASFFVGRFNLYATKNITDTFHMMAEVRFMYAPNGAALLLGGGAPQNTEFIDYTGNGSFQRWGGIMMERAYGEWSPYPFFNLRVGQFLTPYGIWNVDHGSPVFIPVSRPYAVNGSFFPERQTGLEAHGRLAISPSLSARYHLTLSNGLGPISEYRDLDRNKAVGGRLALEYTGFGTFQVGGSTFYGQNTAGFSNVGINSRGTGLSTTKLINDQADVTAMAADIMWKYKGFHFQAEWVGERREYTKIGRRRSPTAGQVGIPPDAMPPDVFNWAGYGLVGYRLPWWGIMPFATLEYQDANYQGVDTRTAFSQVGLNIRPTGAVVLKLEYQFAFAGTEETQIKVIASQLAWAF